MSYTNYLEDKIQNHIFMKVTYTPTGYLGLALWIGNPGELGNGGAEVSGASYERVNTVFDDWSLSSGGGHSTNIRALTFPEAAEDWGTVTYFALCDNPYKGLGIMLIYGILNPAKIIPAGSIPRFDVGELDVYLE